jgi:antibiotic biosynthesis monooxygenase (ABM) superfamily enzyme
MTVAMADEGVRPCTASTTGAVTLVVARRVLPGREADYERLLRVLHQQVHGTRGYLGTEVVHNSAEHEYVSIVRFDSLANLRAWEASGQRERWQVELDGIVTGDATVRHAEGLEFWFESTEPSSVRAPSRHKMALVLVVVVAALSMVLVPLITRLVGHAPRFIRVTIGAIVQVVLLTYVVMPRVTRLLAFWLFPSTTSRRDASAPKRHASSAPSN